jgi:hypothetical protein
VAVSKPYHFVVNHVMTREKEQKEFNGKIDLLFLIFEAKLPV